MGVNPPLMIDRVSVVDSFYVRTARITTGPTSLSVGFELSRLLERSGSSAIDGRAFIGVRMIRVAVVDDHPLARRGVEQILADHAGLQVVVSASTAHELCEQLICSEGLESGIADVLIVDLYHDGGGPCLEAVANLAGNNRVLVMSASARPADVLGAVRAGASGYVTKHLSPNLFVSAVETVATGGFYLSSQLADILHAELTRSPNSTEGAEDTTVAYSTLSRREEQTLDLIARGFTHAQIATRMGVSKATVDTYVERVRAKLHVGNKAELTRAALTHLPHQVIV